MPDLFNSYSARLTRSLFTISLSLVFPLFSQASPVKPSRDAAWTPKDSQQAIEFDGPYQAQLVASEPLIKDPVEICWDAQGRCYVVEMRDYPLGGPDGKMLSQIQILTDRNQDGVYDEAVVFADGLDHAQGILPHRDGLIVTTRTQVLFLRDTNGDGIADEKRPLIAGFNPSFSQLQIASPRRGLDGEVYFNNGLDSKEIYPYVENEADAQKLNIARHNLRWNPVTGKLTPTSGFGQFGGSFDDWGRHYSSSNRSPVMLSVMPREFLEKHPDSGLTQGWENIAPFGPESRVYPLQITHTTSDAHSGTNTSACGITVYRGHLMPELLNNFFVCDPTGQLISRFHAPEVSGASLRTNRIGQKTEFFRSRDEWCRPVNLTTGPDGALYVCDIYRQYIDHARFFPDEFVQTHDMRSGENQGRIWRIVPKDLKELPAIEPAPKDHTGLVKWLSHPNAWQRETAQRLLLETAQDQPAEILPILDLLHKSATAGLPSAQARLHHLWTFANLLALLPPNQQTKFIDSDWVSSHLQEDKTPEIAENLVIIKLRYPHLFAKHTPAVIESSPRSLMLNLAITQADATQIEAAIQKVIQHQDLLDDPWFQAATFGHLEKHHGHLAHELLKVVNISTTANDARIGYFRKLAALSTGSGNVEDFGHLLQCFEQNSGQLTWWKLALIQGIADGLPKSNKAFGAANLAAFLGHSDEKWQTSRNEIRDLMQRIDQVLQDPNAPLDQRLACLPLLSQRKFEDASALLKTLLDKQQAPELTQAAFNTLKRYGAEKIAPLLYEILPSSSPSLRREIVLLLASNQKTVVDLFQRMERKEVSSSLVDAETRWRYLQSKDPVIKELAEKLFQRPSEDRAAVITQYLPSTKMKGDPEKGRQVYQTICMVCHSYQGVGIAVGPDISDVRAKEKEALLSDILDPNRMIEARWSAYQIETKDGRTLVGLMENESTNAITLKMPGGISESVDRSQITTQKSLDASLMPVGLEGAITVEQMADLLAFLQGK